MLCRGLIDDGTFHEACEKVQREDVPYFRQFSTTRLPQDHSSPSSSDLSPAPSPPHCDSLTSATRDAPAVSVTSVATYYIITTSLTMSVCLDISAKMAERRAALHIPKITTWDGMNYLVLLRNA